MAQRLNLLVELLRPTAKIGVLVNPNNRFVGAASVADAEAAASAMGRPIEVFSTSSGEDIDAAFASFAGKQIGALIVSPTFCSPAAANSSSLWPPDTDCPQSIPSENFPK